jgi:hypothetical protein
MMMAMICSVMALRPEMEVSAAVDIENELKELKIFKSG